MKKLVVSGAVAFSVLSSFAVDAVWVKTGATGNWADAANWTDAAGAPLATAPASAEDTATLAVPSDVYQTVTMPGITPFAIGTVYGDPLHCLVVGVSGVSKSYVVQLGDTSGYDGTWSGTGLYPNFSFTGAKADVRMSELNVTCRPKVTVPEGTKVSLEALYAGGSLQKEGVGTLSVGPAAVGESQIFYHNGGTLELQGRDGADGAAGDPIFWVDASKTNLMDLALNEANGHLEVLKWSDCRSADGSHTAIAAIPIDNAKIAKPWISSWRQNGLPVVDFGVLKGGTAGATSGDAASLQYSLNDAAGKNVNIMEYFVVWMDTLEGAYSDVFPVGQTGAHNFHRGYNNGLGQLFDSAADANVKNGRIRLDGSGASTSSKPIYGQFHLLNCTLVGNGLRPNAFCNDRQTTRYGGGRIAEAIFYTNALTAAERAVTTAYLRHKWFGAPEARALKLGDSATAVSVPEGKSAQVREAVLASGKPLRKEGGGTLRVGAFQPEAPTLEVAGGAVAFDADVPAVADDAPAADPYFWADADKADSFEYAETVGGTNFVSRWNDCRAGATAYASVNTDKTYGNRPFISGDTCNGKAMLDFGTPVKDGGNYRKGTSSYMTISGNNVIREAFQLVRFPRDLAGYYPNIFAGGSTELIRENGSTILNNNYAWYAAAAGVWTMNGRLVDPWAAFSLDTSCYYVASFSSESTPNAHWLGTDRGYDYGDTRIGEFIAYDRRLTDAERRQTVAYLLRKWRNEASPFVRTAHEIAKLTFTAGNPEPKVVADVDTTVREIAFDGNTTFTKAGAAKLTIATTLPNSLRAISVEGDLDVKHEIDCFPEAAFHVDASKIDSFEFLPGTNAIVRWNDCRGNGIYAKNAVSATLPTNALYRTAAEDDGSGLVAGSPYVDMTESTGMSWYNAAGTAFTYTNLREYHVVFKITESGNYQPIGGPDYYSAAGSLNPSGYLNTMFWGSGCQEAKTAYKVTDQETEWRQDNFFLKGQGNLSTTKFYVQTLVATNDLRANSFSIDRGSVKAGKVALCEAILICGQPNSLERARQIHDHLVKKWKGLGDGCSFPVVLDRFEIADGGSASIPCDMPFSIARLTGSGTYDLAAVEGVEQIDVAIDGEGNVPLKTVSGDVSFADAVTVRVTIANPKAVKGLYTIFTADSLANVDDVDFDVQVDNPGRNAYRLRKTPKSLLLEVLPPGGLIIIR